MTFRSLSIASHESRLSAHETFGATNSSSHLFSLNAYTFPASAVVFAKEHELTIDYVDNAWARIAMDGKLLKQFLAYGAETEPDLEMCLAKIQDDKWYLVSEEEF